MDTVVVFFFLALVQFSQATSPIFEPQHGAYKGINRKKIHQNPVAQSSYLDPSLFFRDSAIKRSFENYSPSVNEPQLSQKRYARNLLNGGTLLETDISLNKDILTNNHEGQKFSSHQSEQNYESNKQHRFLRNKQDFQEHSLGREPHSLFSTNEQSDVFLESQKKTEKLNKDVSNQKINEQTMNQQFNKQNHNADINEKSSIVAAKVDVDNKELSLSINASNIQQVITGQILSNQRESQALSSDNNNHLITTKEESSQSPMSSRNTENNQHSENQQSYSSQSQKQSFTRQDDVKSNDNINIIDQIKSQTNSPATNDNHLLVSNIKEVAADEQNEQQNYTKNIVTKTEEKENQSKLTAIENQNANQSEDIYDSEEDEFWEKEDTYIYDDTAELNEPINLGTQNQPTGPSSNDQSSIKLSQDQPSLQPDPEQHNQNQSLTQEQDQSIKPDQDETLEATNQGQKILQGSHNQSPSLLNQDKAPLQLNQEKSSLQPTEDQPSIQRNRKEAPVPPNKSILSLLLDKDTQPNQFEHNLNESEQPLLQPDQEKQYPLKKDSEQTPAQSDQDLLPTQSSQEQNQLPTQLDLNRQLIVNLHKDQATLTSNQNQPSTKPDQDELPPKMDLKQPILAVYQNQEPTLNQVSELQSSLQPDQDHISSQTDRSQFQTIPDTNQLYSKTNRDFSKTSDLNKLSKPHSKNTQSITMKKQTEKDKKSQISSETSKDLKKMNSVLDETKATQRDENQLMQDELSTQLDSSLLILSEEQPTKDLPMAIALDKNASPIQTSQDQIFSQIEQAKPLPQQRQDQSVVQPEQDQQLTQPGQNSSLLQPEHDQPIPLTMRDEPLTQSGQDQVLAQIGTDESIIQSSQNQPLTQSRLEQGQLIAVLNQDQLLQSTGPVLFPKISGQEITLPRLSYDEKSKIPNEVQNLTQRSEDYPSTVRNKYTTPTQLNQPTEIGDDEFKKQQSQHQINHEKHFAQQSEQKQNTKSKEKQPASNGKLNSKIHDQKIWTQALSNTYQYSQSTKQTEQSQIILSNSDQNPIKESSQEQPRKQKGHDFLIAPSGQNTHIIQPTNRQKYPLNKTRHDKPTDKFNQDVPAKELSKDKASTKFGIDKPLAIPYQGKPAQGKIHHLHKPTTIIDQYESETKTDQPITEHDENNHVPNPDQDKAESLLEDKPKTKPGSEKPIVTSSEPVKQANIPDENKYATKNFTMSDQVSHNKPYKIPDQSSPIQPENKSQQSIQDKPATKFEQPDQDKTVHKSDRTVQNKTETKLIQEKPIPLPKNKSDQDKFILKDKSINICNKSRPSLIKSDKDKKSIKLDTNPDEDTTRTESKENNSSITFAQDKLTTYINQDKYNQPSFTPNRDEPLTLSDENKLTNHHKNDNPINKPKQDQIISQILKPVTKQDQGEPVKFPGQDKYLTAPERNIPENNFEQDKPAIKFDEHKPTTETDQTNSRFTLDETIPKTQIVPDNPLKKTYQDMFTTKLQKDTSIIIPEEGRPSSNLDLDKGLIIPEQETLVTNSDNNKPARKPKQDETYQHQLTIKPSEDKSVTTSGHDKPTIKHKQDNPDHTKPVESNQSTSILDQKQSSTKPKQIKPINLPDRTFGPNSIENKPVDKSAAEHLVSKRNKDSSSRIVEDRDQNKAVTHNRNEDTTTKSEQRQPENKSNQDKSNNKESTKPLINQQTNTKLPTINTDTDTKQTRYTEDFDDLKRFSKSQSEIDSISQRRGRYDLSRSSGRQDVQQAIETEVNYKTLIVGDGSRNGRCYCSCDVNSKPVFISLDRLPVWP